MTFVFTSHVVCAMTFLAMAMLLASRALRAGFGPFLTAACGVTAAWALAAAVRDAAFEARWLSADWLNPLVSGLEVLRGAAWLAFLGRLLTMMAAGEDAARAFRLILAAIAAGTAVVIASDLYFSIDPSGRVLHEGVAYSYLGRLTLALAGLAMIENLLRNTPPERFWSIKFYCFGLGGLFAYDFFAYADAVLFRQVNFDLVDARGAITLLVAPLIAGAAHRNPVTAAPVALSRRFAFHTAAILGAGVYLLLVSAAGYYVQRIGGTSGSLLQTVFIFGVLILFATIIASGSFRARAKVFIAKNFYAYRYDYREEWLGFINTIGRDVAEAGLRERVIKAVANLVDSPGGAMLQWEDSNQRYTVAASWNYGKVQASEPADGSLARFLVDKGWVIRIDEYRLRPQLYGELALPDWLREMQAAWLVVPLIHHKQLLALIVLQQPRAPRELNWEDYDLLKTIGRQAASYLGEYEAMRTLADARQMELFNRRFAFVIHDIKTLISQLSLLLSNADKHGNNPAFQRDLIAMVRDSVDGMQRLLAQINAERRKDQVTSVVDVIPLTRALVSRRASLKPIVSLDCEAETLNINGDEARLASILNHLIQNAMEAAGENGKVWVRLRRSDGSAVLEVEDNGPGMDAEFIRDQLFRPFKSTKDAGYGIGAYQCRELVRELKGQLMVTSVPGRGTVMQAAFPAVDGATLVQQRARTAT
jgi:putative PEP-CTERM system histidine kinase